MTQDEFQQIVLDELKVVKNSVRELETRSKKQGRDLEDVKKFTAEQMLMNTNQKETNKNLEMSYAALCHAIDKKVFDHLQGFSDEIKLYADLQIRDHEQCYRHVPAH